MQTLLISVFSFFSAYIFGLTASAGRIEALKSNFNTPIRVLLDRGQQEITLKSVLKTVFIKKTGDENWKPLKGQTKIKISPNKTSLLVDGADYKTSTLYIRGGTQHTDPIQYRANFYRGALKLNVSDGRILLTNIIPVEEYLYGQVAGEMSPHWELEALKAQVVAARSYALYMIRHPKSSFYDLEKGTADQVYLGAQSESDRIRVAVESTKNEVVTKGTLPIKTYYHSRCGGHTESAKAVWNTSEKNHKVGVPCPYCRKFPLNWQIKIKAAELFNLLKIPHFERKPFKIGVLKKTPSGRVNEISIEADNKKFAINSEDLRNLLGYTNVKSTRFEISNTPEEVIFDGTGAGHGVGMCQWGAQFLAKKGKTYREILAHYYPSYKISSNTQSLLP